jgi:hypothetical protein
MKCIFYDVSYSIQVTVYEDFEDIFENEIEEQNYILQILPNKLSTSSHRPRTSSNASAGEAICG